MKPDRVRMGVPKKRAARTLGESALSLAAEWMRRRRRRTPGGRLAHAQPLFPEALGAP